MDVRKDKTVGVFRACGDITDAAACPTSWGCKADCADGSACCDCLEGDAGCDFSAINATWFDEANAPTNRRWGTYDLTTAKLRVGIAADPAVHAGDPGGDVPTFTYAPVAAGGTATAADRKDGYYAALYAAACCETRHRRPRACYPQSQATCTDPSCTFDAAARPRCRPKTCEELADREGCTAEGELCAWKNGTCRTRHAFNVTHLTPDRCSRKADATACADTQGCTFATGSCLTLANAGFGAWKGTAGNKTAHLFVQRYPTATYATVRPGDNAEQTFTVRLDAADDGTIAGTGKRFTTSGGQSDVQVVIRADTSLPTRMTIRVPGGGQSVEYQLEAVEECAAAENTDCIPRASQSILHRTHDDSLAESQWSLPVSAD